MQGVPPRQHLDPPPGGQQFDQCLHVPAERRVRAHGAEDGHRQPGQRDRVQDRVAPYVLQHRGPLEEQLVRRGPVTSAPASGLTGPVGGGRTVVPGPPSGHPGVGDDGGGAVPAPGHEGVDQHHAGHPGRVVDGVAQGHDPAVAVTDQGARPERHRQFVEVGSQLGQRVPARRAFAPAVPALVVEEDPVVGRQRRGQPEVPRRHAAGEQAVDQDDRRVAGVAEGLHVEFQTVGGQLRHATTKSTSCPTVRRMIWSSSNPAIQSTKSTCSP